MREEKDQSSQSDDSDFQLTVEREPIEEEPIGHEPVRLESQIETPSEPPKKSGAGFVIKIIAGVVILGVVGVGVSLATRIWDPLWNPFRPSPEKVIEEMTTNMEKVKILHFNWGIDIFASEKDAGEFKVFIGLEGDSDATNSENLKVALDFNIGLAIQTQAYAKNKEENFSLAITSKTIGEVSYLRLNTIIIPADLEPFLLMFDISLDEIKGQWIKIDKEALEELGGETYSSQEMSKEEQEKLVKKLKEVFAKRKIYYIKEEMSDEKINGKKVYHYLLALDKEEIKKVIPEMFKIIMESSGQSSGVDEFTSAFVIGGLTESINKFFEKIGDITAEIWIGKKDKLLYRIKGEKEIDLSKFDEKIEGIINIKITSDFSNFNQPVEIEPPENFKSLEEILSQFQLPFFNQLPSPSPPSPTPTQSPSF